jgi:hypothetical protein
MLEEGSRVEPGEPGYTARLAHREGFVDVQRS